MALLFFDGFDHSGTEFGVGAHSTKYGAWVGSNGGLVSTPTRTGPGALNIQFNTFGATTKTLPVSGTTAIVGVAARFTAGAASLDDVIRVLDSGTVHVAVSINTARQLVVRRGTTTLATGATVLALNTWYYLELRCTIHDTAGAYELRIDGGMELAATAVDTQNAATAAWQTVRLGGVASNVYYDDFYVCDGSGVTRNDFLGPVKVETLLPQTDAVAVGSNAGLTPSTGTDHGALVDENPSNTSDYNSAATVGLKDTYNYPSLSLTGTILGIQTNLYVQKSDAAARQVCAVVRTGGADYDGANVAPLTTFSYFSEVRAQKPAGAGGGDWSSGDIASLEAGMKVTV